MTGTVPLTLPEVAEAARSALARLGYDAADAAVVAGHLVAAEAGGHPAFGLARCLDIAAQLATGAPAGAPLSWISAEGPFIVVDGGGGLGYLAVERALERGRVHVETHGMALVGVRNVFFTGLLRVYAEALAERGLASWSTSAAAPPVMVAPGHARPTLGTNPFALGIPGSPRPLLFDSATTLIAYSQVVEAQRHGTALPPGSAVDSGGAATVAPEDVLDGGGLLPWAGHRGWGLAAAVQAFGMLVGGSARAGHLADCSMVAVLVDAERLGRIAGATPLVELHAALASGGGAGPQLPGDRWAARQERARLRGVDVDEVTLRRLRDVSSPPAPLPPSDRRT